MLWTIVTRYGTWDTLPGKADFFAEMTDSEEEGSMVISGYCET